MSMANADSPSPSGDKPDLRNDILREVYEVSAEHRATQTRLRQAGTSQDAIGDTFYIHGMRAYLDQMLIMHDSALNADSPMRHACINLATLALEYAMKLRLR